MPQRALLLGIAGCIAGLFLATTPARGQVSNLDTVEGPGTGERTTLTMTPHALADGLSARALGVQAPNSNRWAITLIGVTRSDSLGLAMGSESLPIEEITRPDEGEVGPTRLYLSQETFLTIAETPQVRLRVGKQSIQFPEQMRQEMKKIFEKVS